MSLITINADFKAMNRMLERIACALERVLLEAYSVRLGHCAESIPDPNPANEASVAYATDEDLARDKLEDFVLRLRRGAGRDSEAGDVEQDRD